MKGAKKAVLVSGIVVVVCLYLLSRADFRGLVLLNIFGDPGCRDSDAKFLLVIFSSASWAQKQEVFLLAGDDHPLGLGGVGGDTSYALYNYRKESVSSIRALAFVRYVAEQPVSICSNT